MGWRGMLRARLRVCRAGSSCRARWTGPGPLAGGVVVDLEELLRRIPVTRKRSWCRRRPLEGLQKENLVLLIGPTGEEEAEEEEEEGEEEEEEEDEEEEEEDEEEEGGKKGQYHTLLPPFDHLPTAFTMDPLRRQRDFLESHLPTVVTVDPPRQAFLANDNNINSSNKNSSVLPLSLSPPQLLMVLVVVMALVEPFLGSILTPTDQSPYPATKRRSTGSYGK